MPPTQESAQSRGQQLRLWPGVVIVLLQLAVGLALPIFAPDQTMYRALAPPVATIVVFLWWLLLSRAPWVERVGAIALVPLAMFGTYRILDTSIATGAQHMLYIILTLGYLGIAFVVWAVATHRLSDGIRRVTMVATILAACGGWALARTGGFTASLHHDLHWRWSATAEDRLVAQSDLPPAPPPVHTASASPEKAVMVPEKVVESPEKTVKSSEKPAEVAATPAVTTPGADWPGFRGPHRDGAVPGIQIKTDWTASPPVAIWRRPVGPGWSSFAVLGDRFYTQEQRGPDEVVACYKLSSGQPVWAHRDAARFWESNGGAGPRGTPTISNGRVYTFGATGIVNALNASDGALVWSRNAASDAAMKTPQWGFASSPLVIGDLVIIGASGRLIAYDRATGTQRWLGPVHATSYSSPVLLNVDGVPQILLLSGNGATSVALADGALLWEYPWVGYPIVQPEQTADGDVLMSVTDSSGIRRIAISHDIAHDAGSQAAAWTVKERWTSLGLKPYFNDFVIHKGYAYGFDGSILSCIDLKDGQRKWKGGRFGNGQLVLLSDQDLMVVTSEEGDLALVRATPDQFTELARVPALEGKTWNHPALAGDILLVRNGEEMVAFRLGAAKPM